MNTTRKLRITFGLLALIVSTQACAFPSVAELTDGFFTAIIGFLIGLTAWVYAMILQFMVFWGAISATAGFAFLPLGLVCTLIPGLSGIVKGLTSTIVTGLMIKPLTLFISGMTMGMLVQQADQFAAVAHLNAGDGEHLWVLPYALKFLAMMCGLIYFSLKIPDLASSLFGAASEGLSRHTAQAAGRGIKALGEKLKNK